MGALDDAAEALEAILTSLNKVYLVTGSTETDETDPNSLSNKVFGCPIVEQIHCSKCQAVSKPQGSDMFIYYAYATEICSGQRRFPHLSFDALLRKLNEEERKSCPNEEKGLCKEKKCPVHKTLAQQPEVFAIGLVWVSPNPTAEEIVETLSIITKEITLSNIFELRGEENVQYTYRLKGMICYYGMHYDCYFWNPHRKKWIVFDDTIVKEVGASWKQLIERCRRGRFHPSVLFYERVGQGVPIKPSQGSSLNTKNSLVPTKPQQPMMPMMHPAMPRYMVPMHHPRMVHPAYSFPHQMGMPMMMASPMTPQPVVTSSASTASTQPTPPRSNEKKAEKAEQESANEKEKKRKKQKKQKAKKEASNQRVVDKEVATQAENKEEEVPEENRPKEEPPTRALYPATGSTKQVSPTQSDSKVQPLVPVQPQSGESLHPPLEPQRSPVLSQQPQHAQQPLQPPLLATVQKQPPEPQPPLPTFQPPQPQPSRPVQQQLPNAEPSLPVGTQLENSTDSSARVKQSSPDMPPRIERNFSNPQPLPQPVESPLEAQFHPHFQRQMLSERQHQQKISQPGPPSQPQAQPSPMQSLSTEPPLDSTPPVTPPQEQRAPLQSYTEYRLPKGSHAVAVHSHVDSRYQPIPSFLPAVETPPQPQLEQPQPKHHLLASQPEVPTTPPSPIHYAGTNNLERKSENLISFDDEDEQDLVLEDLSLHGLDFEGLGLPPPSYQQPLAYSAGLSLSQQQPVYSAPPQQEFEPSAPKWQHPDTLPTWNPSTTTTAWHSPVSSSLEWPQVPSLHPHSGYSADSWQGLPSPAVAYSAPPPPAYWEPAPPPVHVPSPPVVSVQDTPYYHHHTAVASYAAVTPPSQPIVEPPKATSHEEQPWMSYLNKANNGTKGTTAKATSTFGDYEERGLRRSGGNSTTITSTTTKETKQEFRNLSYLLDGKTPPPPTQKKYEQPQSSFSNLSNLLATPSTYT